jgi:hypothetical protein
MDLSSSPDPVICSLIARKQAVDDELAILRQAFQAYLACDVQVDERPERAALAHYSMLDSSNCGCAVCKEWEQRRAEFVSASSLIPKGHKWTICGCADCRFVGRIQLNYLAASNRRDLLIEMAFHAHFHSRSGRAIMAWLDVELQKPQYTTNWMAQEFTRFPMERWLRKCEMALTSVLSGQVWIPAAGVTELLAPLGSSLAAIAEMHAG